MSCNKESGIRAVTLDSGVAVQLSIEGDEMVNLNISEGHRGFFISLHIDDINEVADLFREMADLVEPMRKPEYH